MDMRSKDILKEALLKYDGTLVVVSHDREFLDGLVDKVYEFRDGGVKEYLGGIRYFLEKRHLEDMRQIEAKDTATKEQKNTSGKDDYLAKKENEKLIRKTQRAIEEKEMAVMALEEEIAEWDRKMGSPEEYGLDLSDSKLFEQYNALKQRLAFEEHEWEKLCYELEILQGL
jgi:ATP-binding cassette subfamily F protein 3